MPSVAIFAGAVLVVLGLAGFWATGSAHPTALIPSAFGLVIGILGLAARFGGSSVRKHTMHLAAAVALLGLFGTMRGLVGLFSLVIGGTVARPAAVVCQAIMALICALFIVLATRSFIQTRRRPGGQTMAG